MQKKVLLVVGCGSLLFLFVLSLFSIKKITSLKSSQSPSDGHLPELVIYTYDALLAKEGLGTAIFSLFENKHHCKVRPVSWGDAVQMKTRLQAEARRGEVFAHVLLGIDQNLWEEVRLWTEPWGQWRPRGLDQVPEFLRIAPEFLPYDYSYLGFIVDQVQLKKKGLPLPTRLSDLLRPEWRRNILLSDPRLSPSGLGFVLYVEAVLGTGADLFWSQLRSQWLTLAPSWDLAYQLFIKEEAPLVWSYLTSQAYHEENSIASSLPQALDERKKPESRYQALVFEEGQPFAVEGAVLVRGAPDFAEKRELAQLFLEFLLTTEVQELIPQKNWMFPVRKDVALPKSYQRIPRPKKIIELSRLSQLDTPYPMDLSFTAGSEVGSRAQTRNSSRNVPHILKKWRRAILAGPAQDVVKDSEQKSERTGHAL